jgi:hypothetical protein
MAAKEARAAEHGDQRVRIGLHSHRPAEIQDRFGTV